jgi:hypothetical protein
MDQKLNIRDVRHKIYFKGNLSVRQKTAAMRVLMSTEKIKGGDRLPPA